MSRIVSCLLSAVSIMAIGCTGGVLASENADSAMTVDEARMLILDMCKAEDGATPESCACYVETIRQTLPPSSYERAMILAAYVAAGDESGAKHYLESSGALAQDFLPLMLELQDAVTKSSDICGL